VVKILEIGESSTKRKKGIIAAAATATGFEEVSDNYKKAPGHL
jgi:hypothetical protein